MYEKLKILWKKKKNMWKLKYMPTQHTSLAGPSKPREFGYTDFIPHSNFGAPINSSYEYSSLECFGGMSMSQHLICFLT